METTFHQPHIALQPYIQGFVHVRMEITDNYEVKDIDLFPIGYGLLSFILNENHQLIYAGKNYNTRFNFTGQLEHHLHIRSSLSSVIYVIFKPFGAYRILGVPQHLLKNDSTFMGDILGKEVAEVQAKMEDHIHQPLEIIDILENWLLSRLQLHHKININRVAFACNQIINNKGLIGIQELNKLCCMSKSSMEQYFKEQIGTSPKVYSRIIRFNEAKRTLKDSAEKSWIEIVENYGYYDQSHFIREFKHFFGYSPSQIHLSYQKLADCISSVTVS